MGVDGIIATEIAARPRRKLALSLRVALALVLFVAAWLGWIAHRARVQRLAIAAVQNANGSIHFNDQPMPNRARSRGQHAAEPAKPGGLRQWMGDEYFHDIDRVSINGENQDAWRIEGAIDALADCPRLEFLDLNGGEVGAASLDRLGDFSSLRHLGLRGRDLTGRDLSWLRRLRNLQKLDLRGSDIDDSTLAHVATLNGLTSLYLSGPNGQGIGNAGLVHLAGLVNLEELDLRDHTQFGDAGIAQLAHLRNLQRLYLGHTNVSDAGVANLQGLASLTYLDLTKTQITDASLTFLAGLDHLAVLTVHDTKVTKEGVAAFHRARPDFRFLIANDK